MDIILGFISIFGLGVVYCLLQTLWNKITGSSVPVY